MGEPFAVRARLNSFRNALRGLRMVVRTQHNAWIHLTATFCVLAMGIWLRLPPGDWCWLIIATTAVWAAEAGNTALERLADASVPDRHPLVRDAKDAAAAAVLVTALGAALIGLVVLGPALLQRLVPPG